MEGTTTTRRATLTCPACGRLNRVDLTRAEHRPKCGSCATPIPLDRPAQAGDRELARIVAGSDVPVVVDFYADWCGPCKIMAPMLDQLARERAGRVLVVKVDTDRSPAASARYGIGGIPTLIAFRGGREVAREVGAVPKPRLDALVARAEAVPPA